MNISGLTQLARTCGNLVVKYAPEILAAVGTASIVGGTVICVKNTPKAYERTQEIIEDMEDIDETTDDISDGQQSKISIIRRNAPSYIRWYAPGALLIGGGIACVLGGHILLRRRLAIVTASCEAISLAYATYRGRVIEKYGKEEDIALLTGGEVIPKNLKIKKKANKGPESGVIAPDDAKEIGSPYVRVFDEWNPNWVDDPATNLLFLKTQEHFANDLLRSRGHLFLNEVFDALGFERTSLGAVTGWILHPEDEHGEDVGDNYVDFGIFDEYWKLFHGELPTQTDVNKREFLNGYQPSILLDFNVDGTIFDKI